MSDPIYTAFIRPVYYCLLTSRYGGQWPVHLMSSESVERNANLYEPDLFCHLLPISNGVGIFGVGSATKCGKVVIRQVAESKKYRVLIDR